MARTRESIEADQVQAIDSKPARGKDRRARKRYVIYQNDDGSPDWGSVSDEDKSALGMGAPKPEAEPPATVAPELIQSLILMGANIEAAVVAPKFGLTQDQAAGALVPAPPMLEQLGAAGARVANKYSASLGRWGDEIMLGVLIVTWQATAFTELRKLTPVKTAEPMPASREQRESETIERETTGTIDQAA